MNENFSITPHRRYNILTGEYALVSPHRTKRPWQEKKESAAKKVQLWDVVILIHTDKFELKNLFQMK